MAESTRFLIVGAGTMGGNHARMLANGRVPGAELAGIVDLDGTRALDLANATGTKAFGDIATAVTEMHPNAAYVATPDAVHRGPVEALARGRVSFEDGVEVTKILVAVHRSLESGQVELV